MHEPPTSTATAPRPSALVALLWTLGWATATFGGTVALAQDTERHAAAPRPFPVQILGELYIGRVNLGRLFDAGLREKIDSGLSTRVILRTQVHDLQQNTLRALGVTEYRIVYRIWEEDYLVREWSALGERSFQLRSYEEVVRQVARQRRLPLATRDDLPAGGRYQAVVEVEVDPVSEELLSRVREYLSNPGGHRAEGGNRGLFGNLARIFFDPRSGGAGAAREWRSVLFGGTGPLPRPQ